MEFKLTKRALHEAIGESTFGEDEECELDVIEVAPAQVDEEGEEVAPPELKLVLRRVEDLESAPEPVEEENAATFG